MQIQIILQPAAYSEKEGSKIIMFEYTDKDVLVNTLCVKNHHSNTALVYHGESYPVPDLKNAMKPSRLL